MSKYGSEKTPYLDSFHAVTHITEIIHITDIFIITRITHITETKIKKGIQTSITMEGQLVRNKMMEDQLKVPSCKLKKHW